MGLVRLAFWKCAELSIDPRSVRIGDLTSSRQINPKKTQLIYAGHSDSQNGRCGLGPPSPAGT